MGSIVVETWKLEVTTMRLDVVMCNTKKTKSVSYVTTRIMVLLAISQMGLAALTNLVLVVGEIFIAREVQEVLIVDGVLVVRISHFYQWIDTMKTLWKFFTVHLVGGKL
ncbi:hypothetical protein PVK06_030598 [Gossypium arboreum]|uniref:Uncharacterized protein n=1 Tax=Gossypium arboreum TaxID=29729 RepID=A0ABR0NNQ1_GOSAR|nr:hypothetical protein PVK06_030598 [Gossypium arboreum]